MSSPTYHIRVPGKLFIAGEYAVLEPGQQVIVIAVNRYMNFQLSPSEKNSLSLPQLGLEYVTWQSQKDDIQFSVNTKRLLFIQDAMTIFNQFLREQSIDQRPFSLTIMSELDDASGRKYGLGSSAAVVVGVITALSHFYQLEFSQNTIFKLSAISHYKTQGNGSCADIAASIYGGWLRYISFQPSWLLSKLHEGMKISDLVSHDWPHLLIEKIRPPSSLKLCVGWTGEEAATAPMVEQIKLLRDHKPNQYEKFLKKSALAVHQLIESFQVDDGLGAVAALALNREALMNVGQDAGVNVETPKLKQLIEIANHFGSGKTSGAGGGDCGIAFVKDDLQMEKLQQQWKLVNIIPLNLHVCPTGTIAQSIIK